MKRSDIIIRKIIFVINNKIIINHGIKLCKQKRWGTVTEIIKFKDDLMTKSRKSINSMDEWWRQRSKNMKRICEKDKRSKKGIKN